VTKISDFLSLQFAPDSSKEKVTQSEELNDTSFGEIVRFAIQNTQPSAGDCLYIFIFYSSQTDSSSNNNINNFTTKQTKQRNSQEVQN
jgi:hypothetical protein